MTTYSSNGSIVSPKNGAQHVALENLARARRGEPPLTPVEVAAIWAYRATGLWPKPQLRGV